MGSTFIIDDQICESQYYPILTYRLRKDKGLSLPSSARKFVDLNIMNSERNRKWVAYVAQQFTHYVKNRKKTKQKTIAKFFALDANAEIVQ